MDIKWIWKVSPELSGQANMRADRAIQLALEAALGEWEAPRAFFEGPPPSLSRSQIQRLIEEKRVTSDEKPIKTHSKLTAGSEVRIQLPPPKPLNLVPEERRLDILFEDEHLLVVNKPPGLTVHPSETQMQGTLVHALLHHVKDLSGIGGVLRPGIVHRIDKDTSGALVVTKTDVAHQRLVETFSKHDLDRKYWALCYGAPVDQRIESSIGRNPADRKKMAMNVKNGRRAATAIRRLEAYRTPPKAPFASWIEATLETGRTHQIRVHLTGIGHSLLGDPIYGTPTSRNAKWLALPHEIQERVQTLPGQALHARTLGFAHPVSRKKLHFEADPPPPFAELLKSLQKYRG